MSDNEIVETGDRDKYRVELQCTTDQFKEFIGNILGETDEISFDFREVIVIDKHAVRNIIEGLQQRVSSQNVGIIARSTYYVKFDSGRNYRLSSITDMLNLSPIGRELTKSMEITIVYLIDFPNKSAPEKQTVTIYFGDYIPRKKEDLYPWPEFKLSSGVHVKIEFTERTWAEDISELIKKILQAISSRSENLEKVKIYDIFDSYSFLIGVMISISTLSIYVYALIKFSNIQGRRIISFIDVENLNIEIVLNLIRLNDPIFIGAATIIGVVFGFIAILLSMAAFSALKDTLEVPNFLFSVYENDIKSKERKLNTPLLKIVFWIGGIILAMSTSILAAYVYDLIIGKSPL